MLSDDKKRQQYDAFGAAGVGGGGGGRGFGGFGGFDFSDLGSMGGGFGDIFESFFGGAGRGGRARADERGGDMEVRIKIDFSEAVSGAKKQISVDKFSICSGCEGKGHAKGSRLVDCADCGGSGQQTRTSQSFFGMVQQSFVCPVCSGAGRLPEKACGECSGDGRVRRKETMAVEIPAGIHSGQTLRISGRGEAGKHGARAGDLYIEIEIKPDPRFLRDGDDIRTAVTLGVLDAILGTNIQVPTVHGNVELKIPEGTQPRQVFRIKGKGMPVLSSSKTGDHYVDIRIEVPRKLSREERRVLEEWKRIK